MFKFNDWELRKLLTDFMAEEELSEGLCVVSFISCDIKLIIPGV